MLLSNEAMVSEFRSSAMTQEAFCKLHDISIEKLRYLLPSILFSPKRISMKMYLIPLTFLPSFSSKKYI